jgi:hypothetical protein
MRLSEQRLTAVVAIEGAIAQCIDKSTGASFELSVSAPGGVRPMAGDMWIVTRLEGTWNFDRCVTMAQAPPQRTFAETMAVLAQRGLIDPSYPDGNNEAMHLAYIGECRWFAYPPNDRWVQAGATLNRVKYRELAQVLDPPGQSTTFPGLANSYAISALTNQNLNLNDLEIVMRVKMTDWTPATISMLMVKDTTVVREFSFYVGTTGIPSFEGGNPYTVRAATAAYPFHDGETGWVRVYFSPVAGTLTFYWADDQLYEPKVWNQLGNVLSFATTNMIVTAAPLTIGVRGAGIDLPLNGTVYKAVLRDGVTGLTYSVFDPEDAAAPGSTTWSTYVRRIYTDGIIASSSDGATLEQWTINGTAAVVAYGTSATFTVPDVPAFGSLGTVRPYFCARK